MGPAGSAGEGSSAGPGAGAGGPAGRAVFGAAVCVITTFVPRLLAYILPLAPHISP